MNLVTYIHEVDAKLYKVMLLNLPREIRKYGRNMNGFGNNAKICQWDNAAVSWSLFYRYSRGVIRQWLPRRRALNKAIQVLQYSLFLGRDVGVPHHHQEDYSFSFGIISCPVQIARVHAKKPDWWRSIAKGTRGGRPSDGSRGNVRFN